MIRLLRLLWTFYTSFALLSWIVTLACVEVIRETGLYFFGLLFWGKVACLGLLFLYIRSRKNKEYYYYHNFGLSSVFLWRATLGFDFSLFLMLISLANYLR
jgi:hypothetical protein